MSDLIAVIVGGLLAIAGGIITTTLLERWKQAQESRNLALAFKGEITSLLELIEERGYVNRLGEIIEQIETTRQPFYMPFKARFKYDRVYEANVDQIGTLRPPLPESVAIFYTRLNSILEDLIALGEGMYADRDLELLLRIYKDSRRLLLQTISHGEAVVETINKVYQLK
jgi:hypothetical protein